MRQVDKNNTEIIDLQYFGSVELYSTLYSLKYIYFPAESIYFKSHHVNRIWIYGSNGLIPLSIPLLGGRNQKGYFKDVQIAEDGNWRRIHWRSIHDCYRKSPWFEETGWQIETLYREPEQYLVNWNLKSMNLVIKLLRLKLDILAQSNSSPQEAKSMIIESIPLIKPYANYPVYQQVFMERFGFAANLSILDLLFCEGPAAISYLQELAAYKSAVKMSRIEKEND